MPEKRGFTLGPISITAEEVRRLFDLRDGVLYWRVDSKSTKAGSVAGGVGQNGYWRIKVNGKSYKRSRLVWLHVTGKDSFPLFIDHKNRDRSDDRPENLRLATVSENQSNRSWGSSSKSGVWCESGKWRARVREGSSRKNLGTFSSEQEAIEAVEKWEAVR